MTPPRATTAASVLPLRPVVFAILLVLRGRSLHGYGIMKAANAHVGHQALLGPGTLYRTLKEMRERGLIEHAAPAPGADARRRNYRLTDFGERVVAAEAERLAGLLVHGELGGLISESRSS